MRQISRRKIADFRISADEAWVGLYEGIRITTMIWSRLCTIIIIQINHRIQDYLQEVIFE